MARRPGGIPRNEALTRAQTAVDEIKPEIDSGIEQALQELAKLIRSAQAGVAGDNWIENASFQSRQIHDVGTTVGAELITFIASGLCEILDAMEAGVNCSMESITCYLDALLMARQEPYRNMRPGQLPELTSGLRRVTESINIVPNGGSK